MVQYRATITIITLMGNHMYRIVLQGFRWPWWMILATANFWTANILKCTALH